MEVIIMPDERKATLLSARLIAAQIRRKPDSTLGLATGRTMENLYAVLADMYKKGELDFSLCRSFNLDEYIGLPENDPPASAVAPDFFLKHNPGRKGQGWSRIFYPCLPVACML